MGLSCKKEFGNVKSYMKKMENELAKEKKMLKDKNKEEKK